jgi:hypothetical protein
MTAMSLVTVRVAAVKTLMTSVMRMRLERRERYALARLRLALKYQQKQVTSHTA